MDAELPLGADARIGTPSDGALVWWSHVPTMPGERLGAIGGFAATSEAAARAVLDEAAARLRGAGCTLAVGPMDGNTWRRYRFVTEQGTEPPFFLEPTNSPQWPEWWRSAGFTVLAEYSSSATRDLSVRDERVPAVAARLAANGVTIRALDAADFERELDRIYDVSVVSFQPNFLYTPLPRAAFVAQYRAIAPQLRPEFVLLAECAGRPVGYLFALPDVLQAKRGEPVTTVVVKTLAVLPGRAYAGLGAWLVDLVHAEAARRGFRRAIHALMHESNRSRNLSAHTARTIRRYALFSRRVSV